MSERWSYSGIAADVYARIRAGEYPPGSAIPSYRRLSEAYAVSKTTAQAAVRMLRTLGVVRGVQGRGVFVTGRPARPVMAAVVPDATPASGLHRRARAGTVGLAAVATVVPTARRPSAGS